MIKSCPVCGSLDISESNVLWSDLIIEWQLTQIEVDYINRQQGLNCKICNNNLRAMALSSAILKSFGIVENLDRFCNISNKIKVLEINLAYQLTPFLKKLPNHVLIEYPKYDMMELDIEDSQFDLVIHSDCLEHLSDPIKALSECYRVLDVDGICIFTVPLVIGRMSRPREGMKKIYHGAPNQYSPDQLVHTEFGADIWSYVIQAGFRSCEIFALEYPSGLSLIARK